MMGAVREWLTSVVVVTLLLSVAQTMIPPGSIRKIAAFTGGLILLVTFLRPVLKTDLSRLPLHIEDWDEAIGERQAELEEQGEKELSLRIAERTASYISDKAAGLGLEVEALVEMKTNKDGIPVPWSVQVTGVPSQELAACIERELDIPRERQVWHGEDGS